ncbi:hypothetical protein ACFE04_023207 [Oxalis oulophora]
MALNFSPRPFPTSPRLPEDKDILEILPPDPFGMGISSTTFTAWLEHIELDCATHNTNNFNTNNFNTNNFNTVFSEEFMLDFNNAMGFQSSCFGDQIMVDSHLEGPLLEEMQAVDDNPGSVYVIGDISSFQTDDMDIVCEQTDETSCYGEAGVPHPAIAFALAYLGVQDLLVVERVCKSLQSSVQSDPLLWRSIQIGQPLNEKITDHVLLRLTSMAQGNLQCLCLVDCTRITDDGLKRVLHNNPRLTKLSVAGCTKLTIDGVVRNLKASKSMGAQGVKQLRIGGLFGMTNEHFEELKLLLDIDNQMQRHSHKPHFFSRTNAYLSLDDDRIMDIEICPMCQNPRLIYDCPVEHCQGTKDGSQVCRACTLCIARCFDCGRCITDSEYVETFCLESVCSDCWKKQSKCQVGNDSSCMDICHHG